MKLVFCLGNPGPKYHQTRHNVGFMIADALGDKQGAEFTEKTKLKALIADLAVSGEKVFVAKPTTFYNDVGMSLSLIMSFYKITAQDVLIVHDELALPLGTLRARTGGSDAGNNGIKSVNQHGGVETQRLRIGVASSARGIIGDTNFVLGTFTKEEAESMARLIVPKALEIVLAFVNGSHRATSHTVDLEPSEVTTESTL